MTALSRAVGPFREFGLAVGALYCLSRMLAALSPTLGLYIYEMMVQPVHSVPLLPERMVRSYDFREIQASDPEVGRMPARPEIKRARFEQGARCLGAYRKGELVAYVWWCAQRYDEDEVRCTFELPAGGRAVFDFDLYVLPEHRGGLAFTALWHGFQANLRAQGIAHSYSRMTRFNLPSRRAHTRMGAVVVGRLLLLRVRRLELLLSTLPPYLGLTTAAAQRLCVTLPPASSGSIGSPLPVEIMSGAGQEESSSRLRERDRRGRNC